MKEPELRAAATCGNCGEKIGKSPIPAFYRVRIKQYVLDPDALQRQQGLGMMISGVLAMHMGPNEDLANLLDEQELTICFNCSSKMVAIAELLEKAQPEKDTEEDG